ncbi:MAG: acyltransferase [Oscillospiraceae bacterium]|jgi:peptidoglycan/LPS O-acetylase OafA/YrhL|nr:acyltransferase [Oscillospiraceae bacterium]
MEKGLGSDAARLLPLDALRGLAALFVFAFHYNNLFKLDVLIPGTEYLRDFLTNQGWQCVQLFFVISGFTFYHVYDRKISAHEISLRNFAVLRLSRLVPLAYLTLVISLGAGIVCRIAVGSAFDVSLTKFFGDLLFLNGYLLREGGEPLNSPMWSLTPELFAYIVFFAATWKLKATPRKLFYAAVTFAVCVQYDRGVPVFFLSPEFTRVLPGFFMGCLSCALWKRCDSGRAKQILTVIAAAATLLCLAAQYYSDALIGNRAFVYSVFGFPGLIIAALNIAPARGLLSLRPFRWVGNMSFGIYLFHFPILLSLREFGFAGKSVWVMLAVLAVTLVVAHVSYYKYEKPVMGRLRRKLIKD